MSWLRRHRPTPSLIISILALIVSLSGVAAAQVGLIGPNQIRDGAIQSRHLATGAVTTSDLANNAVTTGKLGDGQVRGPDIQTGAVQTSDIAAGAVDRGRIALDAVDHTRVQDGALDSADLPPQGILPNRMAAIPAVTVSETPPSGTNSAVVGPCVTFSPTWATVEGTDTFNMHTPNPVNSPYLVAPQAGRYRVSAVMAWDGADGGRRFFDFQVNNLVTNTSYGATSGDVANTPTQSSSIEVVLPAGGEVSILAASCNHTSGPDLSTVRATRFQMTWVGNA